METSLSINIARLFSALIKGYQKLLSPLLGPHCRFYPSCSDYARQALGVYGLYKGAWLASKRLLRCHPLTVGGDDPLPPKTSLHHLNVE